MKVLLIGGTGVISHDIAMNSLQQDIELSILTRGIHKNELPSSVKVLRVDIRKKEEAMSVLSGYTFDVVVDFISYNAEQLKNTLEIVHDKCKQYIFISSATAYHDNGMKAITEDVPVDNHAWIYATNKQQCEAFLKEECKRFAISYTIIRPYVTYGDTRIPFGVISRSRQWSLIYRMKSRKPVILWDNGEAVCTLTHTSEFAKGTVGLFMNPKAFNEAFHITSSIRYTWNEVLEIIAHAAGIDSPEVIHIPSAMIEKEMKFVQNELTGDKARNHVFDNSKIKAAVKGFDCRIDLKEGMRRTIRYYQSNPYISKVDFEWDARTDRLISKYCRKVHTSRPENINFICDSGEGCFKKRLIYQICRNDFSYALINLLRNIKNKVRG